MRASLLRDTGRSEATTRGAERDTRHTRHTRRRRNKNKAEGPAEGCRPKAQPRPEGPKKAPLAELEIEKPRLQNARSE